ncbi:MAG: hypothetical protein LBT76_01505 [Tannerella sp.]|jgi:hypothetical protein|nr:hypothetical protein [Tannerella sp.]
MMEEISRKKFLRTVGSVVAGGAVAGVSGTLLTRSCRTGNPAVASGQGRLVPSPPEGQGGAVASPYRQVASFAVQGIIKGFEQSGERIYVATAGGDVQVFDNRGKRLVRFPVGENVRDLAVDSDSVYVLYPSKIEVYSPSGERLREWEACSGLSDYCAFAVAQEFVFVTDAAHKNICKYTAAGGFVKFIHSPEVFIIPSLTFGIACVDDVLYCSNSGRHQVERYTLEGDCLGSFGKPGGAPGLFAGCCNPVHLACTSGGDVITSEKGHPRISCYGSDGQFRGILLDSPSLGGGHAAYDVKVREDRLFVAGKDRVSVYRYDKTAASASACANCPMDCSLSG